jgi:hypothetical protein
MDPEGNLDGHRRGDDRRRPNYGGGGLLQVVVGQTERPKVPNRKETMVTILVIVGVVGIIYLLAANFFLGVFALVIALGLLWLADRRIRHDG